MPSKCNHGREGDASDVRPAASRPEDEVVVTAHGPRARAGITSAERRWRVFGGFAFLAIYVLTRTDARPHIAGMCLALMSVKPQLALVFGIFLLFTGRWRAMLWSLPATACLIGLSVAAFGVKPWVNFVEWTMPFHAKVFSLYVHEVLRAVVSLYSAVRLMGFSAPVGYGLQ